MTDKEKTIRWFENIANECDKLTSGNVAHLKAQIKGIAIRSAEYLTKNSQEPVSEDLEQAADKYALTAKPDDWWADNGGSATPLFYMSSIREAVRFGAQWQKEQMMKDAFSCEVDFYAGKLLAYTQGQLDDALEKNGAKIGDKVKVIIIKE